MNTLTLTPDALALLSDILDMLDDDEDLADNTGASLETIEELRTAVAEALRAR